MSRECPHELCFNCSQPGHQARQCPEPRGQAASTARCLRCGSLQHTDWTRCDRGYDEEDVARVMCYVCAELGHLCCAPVALDSWDDESGDIGSCYRCGEAGHVGARCTSVLGGQPVCFRCNKVGHLARMCPLNQSRSGHFTLGMGFGQQQKQLPAAPAQLSRRDVSWHDERMIATTRGGQQVGYQHQQQQRVVTWAPSSGDGGKSRGRGEDGAEMSRGRHTRWE